MDFPANPHRGDVTLQVLDRQFTMRPSHEAIAEIETVTGRGILAIFRDLTTREIRFTEMAAVVAAGIRAAGEPQATVHGSMQLLYDEGLTSERLYASLTAYILNILNGGRTDTDTDEDEGSGEAKDPTPTL